MRHGQGQARPATGQAVGRPGPCRPDRCGAAPILSCVGASPGGRGATLAEQGEAERRQSSAQPRYLSAIKTLATVGKLLRPAPTAFELARRSVAETPAALVQRGNLAANPLGGVPVVN